MSNIHQNSTSRDTESSDHSRLAGNDRELLSATETLKLFTFAKPSRDSEFDSQGCDVVCPAPKIRHLHQQDSSQAEKQNRIGVSSEMAHHLNRNQNSISPTADELLRMLTSRSVPNSKPPPIPPKPKTSGDFSNGGSLASEKSSFRFYLSSKTNTVVPDDEASSSDTGEKYDAYKQESRLNYSDRDDLSNQMRQLSLNVSNGARHPPQQRQQPKHKQTMAPIRHRMHESTTEATSIDDRMIDNVDNRSIKPIVTESPEEANNNNITKQHKTTVVSTVEILEVPLDEPDRTSYKSRNNFDKTRSRSFHELQKEKEQLFNENNSFTAPYITSAAGTDDEDPYSSYVDVALPTEREVETILNESSYEQPPRTSTPNSDLYQESILKEYNVSKRNTFVATSGASVSSNEKTDSQRTQVNELNEPSCYDDDHNTSGSTLNVSKETDDLGVLNQSAGCELVGLNDSKDSPRSGTGQDRVPYTVKLFNESTMYSTVSPTDGASQQESHTACSEKIRRLEGITELLQQTVDKLKCQVADLTTKLTFVDTDSNAKPKTDEDIGKRTIFSPSGDKPCHLNENMSQSNSVVNRLSAQITSSNPVSYSRSQVATISRNAATPCFPNKSMNNGGSKYSSTLSCHNTVTKTPKRDNFHASTSSLYNDKNASISPSFNYRQSTSPTSLLSLSNRRDPMAYTSLLSLSSLGQSTLKKSSAASGSISNLSQIGSQISNWPSMSDFVTSKHRAKDIIYDEEERLIRMVLYNNPITMRVPSWVGSGYNIDKIVEPPNVRLKLDWVHGYRGRDCRTNLFYLPTGECVYFVAAIVVLYNPTEKTQRHYLGHTESVKCLAVHPNKLIVASGQSAVQNKRDKRPIVRVWNTVSLATLRVIGFNEDFDKSICCLAFSKHDQGATLAVVDESNEHTITVLDWQREKNWRLAEANSGHEQVLAIDFHPIDKYSLVAVGKSSINFWDTTGMTLTKKAGLFDKHDRPKYVLCVAFNDFGDTITGDSNGNIIIWPRGNNRPRKVIYNAHQGGVFSVLPMKDGSYLTGGRDRRIVEWDESLNRTGREAELPEHCGGVRYITSAKGMQVLVGTLRNCILMGSLDKNFVLIMQGHTEATSALAIHPHQNQYLTGGFDEQIHLFDSKTHDIVWSKCLMMSATAAGFSPNGTLLVVGSTLGKWLVIDVITQEILFTKCDGSGTINCIKFSPDGEFFCMGSGDNQIYIYQTTESGNKFCKLGTCVGHSTPVKEIDWTEDGRHLQSQSMNFELLYWSAITCRPLDEQDIIEDLRWFTHNCTLGFQVIGIWSDSIDSALINYCDKSNDEDLMVSVSDTGNLNIFKWPPCYNQCLSQKYYGNVDKFNSIKFLPDDSKLIAIGAKSCVTTEWIVDKESI